MYPLHKYSNIQLYNDHLFKPHSPSILKPSRDLQYKPIDKEYFKSHTPLAKPLPTIKELYHATNTSEWPIEEIPFAPAGLTHLHIHDSKYKLLFIKFTPVIALIPLWYLIQVDLDTTLDMYPNIPPNVTYYCVFLAKHPNDIHKSNEFSWWWPEWNDYSKCKDTNGIIYVQQYPIQHKQTPNINRYI